jgi:hypothetical protein
MADIEFTHSGYGLLQISGRVGQTVAITLDGGPGSPASTVFTQPLPVGLIYDYTADLISGTLLAVESHSYIGAEGPMLQKYNGVGGMTDVDGQVDILPALVTPSTISLEDLTAILEALNPPDSGGGTTTPDPNLPVPDPNGGLNGTNAEGDISVPIDFDLTTRQVFIPNGYSLPAAGEESKVDLPDWAPGTFSIGAIMSVKENDRFPVALGCLRPAELIEVGGLTNIEFFARERAGERRFDISESGFVQMEGVMRYKVILNLQSAGLKSILKSYESVNGAYVDLMCEIRLTITIPAVGSGEDSILVRTSHTFALRFEQKMGS